MSDIEQLLAPIPGPNPCGEDMGFSREFDEIREARRQEDASLAQGDWVSDVKQADWAFVTSQCEAVLTQKSKDLRVAGWLGESLIKERHFAGVTQGCEIMQGLIDQYWDDLYPLIEDDDPELRIGTLTWFVVQSAAAIRQLPLTKSNKGHYSFAQYEDARTYQIALERNPDLRYEMPDDKLTLSQVQEAQRATPRDVYIKWVQDLDASRKAWESLAASIDARLGIDGPSFKGVFESFDAVGNLLKRVAREVGAIAGGTLEAAPESGAEAGAGAAGGGGHAGLVISGPIQSRAQALQMLTAVSDFFRHTEPHSPVTYLAQKAVDWGNMPLHEWLKNVIKDGGSLSHVQELLGIKEHQDE